MERSRQVSKDNDVVRDTTLRSDVSKRSMGDELSLYIEDDITAGEHFSINPGLRLSLFHTGGKVYFCPEPRLSMKTTMGRGWAVKLSCSRMTSGSRLRETFPRSNPGLSPSEHITTA